MQHETVIVLDFGGQYNQLIARRVRENNVYCEIYSYKTDLSVIKAKNPKGIIFTGGPNSVYLEDSPTVDPEIFSWGVPVLGICYGSQLMMHLLGGHVCRAPEREYGKTAASPPPRAARRSLRWASSPTWTLPPTLPARTSSPSSTRTTTAATSPCPAPAWS